MPGSEEIKAAEIAVARFREETSQHYVGTYTGTAEELKKLLHIVEQSLEDRYFCDKAEDAYECIAMLFNRRRHASNGGFVSLQGKLRALAASLVTGVYEARLKLRARSLN